MEYLLIYNKKALSKVDCVWIEIFWNIREILQMAE